MERGRHGGTRLAPGSGPSTAAGLPQGTPMIPVLRALLPPLLPPPPPPTAVPDPVSDPTEPRYFPTCPACQVDAEQGGEWTWFGSRGGCGHGMHPLCWGQYVTHCAMSARGSLDRAGLSFDARGCLQVKCPTCRRVTGEIELSASSGGRLGRVEQIERLVIPGSEPGGSPIFIRRVARVASPEHVDREDGRLRAPAIGAERRRLEQKRARGGTGTGLDGRPVRPPRPPSRPEQGLPRRRGAIRASPALRWCAAPRLTAGGRWTRAAAAMTARLPLPLRGGRSWAVATWAAGTAAACEVLDGRTAGAPGGPSCTSSSNRGSRAAARQ